MLRDKRGSMAVWMLAMLFILVILSTLISEYMRVNAMVDRVEAQLNQAVNVALEAAMVDSHRIDGTSSLHEEDARENLRVFFTGDIGLTSAYESLTPSGATVYALDGMNITITEEPPHIDISCTLVIPSLFSAFSDIRVPMVIRSRNVRLN